MERRGQIVGRLQPQGLEHPLLVRLCREHNDAQGRALGAQRAQQLEAVHPLERDIQDHHAHLRVACGRQRRLAALRGLAFEAHLGERVANRLPEETLVVDDEDARHGLGHGLLYCGVLRE